MKSSSILTTKEVKFKIIYEKDALKILLKLDKENSIEIKNASEEIYNQIRNYISTLKEGYREVLRIRMEGKDLVENILTKLIKWDIGKKEIERSLKEKHNHYVPGYLQEQILYEENKIRKVWFIPFSRVFSIEILPEIERERRKKKEEENKEFSFKAFPSSNFILYPTPMENQKIIVTTESLVHAMNELGKIERKRIFEIFKATLKIFREQKYEETKEAFQFEIQRRLSAGVLTPSNFKNLNEFMKNISVLSEIQVFGYETILPIIWYHYLSQREKSEHGHKNT